VSLYLLSFNIYLHLPEVYLKCIPSAGLYLYSKCFPVPYFVLFRIPTLQPTFKQEVEHNVVLTMYMPEVVKEKESVNSCYKRTINRSPLILKHATRLIPRSLVFHKVPVPIIYRRFFVLVSMAIV